MKNSIYDINNLKFLYRTNPETELNPVLELYRGKIYCNILKNFIFISIKNLGKEIFSIKKSYPRTLTNILSSWLFVLYSKYDFLDDPFLPSNYPLTESLELIFTDLVKYNKELDNVSDKINKIMTELKKNYAYNLQMLKKYASSDYYNKLKGNYTITKKITKHVRNDKDVLFYNFNIHVGFYIRDKRLSNIVSNIILPKSVYDKCYQNYSGDENKMDTYLWIILFRYQLLGSNNHQLGVLPKIFTKMKQDFGLNYECFASSINFTLGNYCSIYYDVEKYFGSKGSFFNMCPISGTYGFNPPYQKDIIDEGVCRIFTCLSKAELNSHNLTFIITIPIWDLEGKKKMIELFKTEFDYPQIDYGEFEIIKKIKASKYFSGLCMIPKEKFTYIDHNFHLYKNATIQNTYVIVLSTIKKNDYAERIGKYNFNLC